MPKLHPIHIVALLGALLCANSQANDAVEEIVVAAEKLNRTTFETGASAAIFTQDDTAITTAGSVSEAFARVPNVAIDPTNSDIIVRGIPRSGFGGAIGTTVYFMDGGPYLAFPRYTTVPIWDLRQIEVLRGAQSTAPIATVAGIVSLVPTAPSDNFEGKIAVEYAPEGDQHAVGLAWGGPISDALAFRIAGHSRQSGGYITNVVNSDDEWNSEDRRLFRIGLAWEPESLEDTEFRLIAQRVDESIDGTPWINRVLPEAGFDAFAREIGNRLPISTDNELELIVLNIEHGISDRWDWNTTLTYHTVDTNSLDALSPVANDPSNSQTVAVSRFDIGSIDTRLIYHGDQWEVVAGLYTADLTFEGFNDFSFDIPFGPLGVAQATRRVVNDNQQKRISALLLASRNYGERWSVDLGIRFQWADPKSDGASTFLRTSSTGDAIADVVIDQILADSNPAIANTRGDTYSEFMPVFSLSYEIDEHRTLGAKIEGGMRWGGQATNAGQQRVVYFDPERATTYELYWRQLLPRGNLRVDANVFLTEFRDQHVFACFSANPLDCHIENAQKSTSSGIEVSMNWAISEVLSLRAGLGMNDTKFDRFEVGNVNWTGNEMPAPDQSYVVGLRYDNETGWFFDIEALFETDAFATAANDPQVLRDERFLVDARIGWRKEHWEASVFARNLFDEEYFDRISFDLPEGISQQAFPGAPRVVGLRFAASW